MSRARDVVATIGLVSFGVIGALVLAELLFRAAGVAAAPAAMQALITRHDTLGWTYAAGREAWNVSGEFRVLVRINSKGLHDLERSYAKRGGIFRILALGDSMTAGLQVPEERVFTRVLEETLNAGHGSRRVEAINAGVSGYGTTQALLYLEHEGRKYQPDVVILGFYIGNDVADNSPRLGGARVGPPESRASLRRLRVYQVLADAARSVGPVAERLIASGVMTDFLLSYDVYHQRPTPQWQEAWAVTKALIVRFQDVAAGLGAVPVVVLFPSREQVHADIWHDTVRRYGRLQQLDIDLEWPNRRLRAFLEERQGNYLDLLPEFRKEAATTRERLYFERDGHWNESGHRLAATAIGEYLHARELLPASAALATR